MADLTQGAVDSLVGLLSTAVTKEAKLLGGLQGDMQFIKDEMESMNGFLIQLTKTEGGLHNDQVRAWMKQVRDISYIAQDCIELYRRDFMGPSSGGLRARLRHLLRLIRTLPTRHRLASRISELKARVKDVGERRERYGVSVPETGNLQQGAPTFDIEVPAASQDEIDDVRDEFVRVLPLGRARDKEKQELPSFEKAIDLIKTQDGALGQLATDVYQSLLPRENHHGATTICMEMLLRALRDHKHVRQAAVDKTKQELNNLVQEKDHASLPNRVMIFCYSKLSRSYKSCLQYLCAFHEETAISRTSLVRRWLAEGRVEKQRHASLEEAAEICFQDLLFRGFLLPADHPASAATKVKSCTIDKKVWDFIEHMSTTENFVDILPTHLEYQIRIRKFVQRQEEHLKNHPRPRHPWSICGRLTTPPPPDDITAVDPDPMDDMLKFLNSLDKTYRLNVLDLGGCKGLKNSHLKSICNVISLKYLSLRKTDVSHLPREINNLILLETLDIRQTKVRARAVKHIFLRKLKHLLTGRNMTEEETLGWAGMPRRIGKMGDMEILSRVQVRPRNKQLEKVGRLLMLRKLGVVLVGSQSEAQDSMTRLLRAITKLRECLRSLSIWVTPPPTNGDPSVTVNMVMIQDYAPKLLRSLDIRGVRFLNIGLPHWIWALQELSEITLCDTFLSKVSLQDLGNKLRHLRRLRLLRNSVNEPKLTFTKDGFLDLRLLIVEGNTISTMAFEDDVATPYPGLIEGNTIGTIAFEDDGATPCPRLKKIVWRNMAINPAGTLSGICHLKMLKEVVLKGHFTNPSLIPPSNECEVRHEP